MLHFSGSRWSAAPAPFALACMLLLLISQPASAQDAILVDSGLTLGQEHSLAVTLGDFDFDGDLDAFVGNGNGEPSAIWLNQGGYTFVEGQKLEPAGGMDNASAFDVAVGDLDGDGDLDVYAARGEIVDNRLVGAPDSVWLNKGNGEFERGQHNIGTAASLGVALGDLDGDGDLDAFVATGGRQSDDFVWFNDGTGNFRQGRQRLGKGWSNAVALGDIDGDGDLDALVANNDQPVAIWLNDGLGTFYRSQPGLGEGANSDIALADLDGDGDLDAFVAGGNRDNPGPNTVWLNLGDGRFRDSGQQLGGDQNAAVAVTLGDVDGDGDVDAYVATGIAGKDQLWLNDGRGNFVDGGPQPSPAIASDAAFGDMNGDSSLDLFLATRDNQPNRVLVNLGGPIFVDSGQQFTNQAGGQDVALGDVDGDGLLDALVVTGSRRYAPNAQIAYSAEIWLNQGGGRFASSGQRLGRKSGQGGALGDVDGDGDLDAFLVSDVAPATVWINHSGRFADSRQLLGDGWATGVALGDLDGDGDLDAFVTRGNTALAPGAEPGNRVWLNIDGRGTYSSTGQMVGVADSRGVALGDVDGDGDLDAVTANARGAVPSQLWLNDGSGRFMEGQAFTVTDGRDVALGDLDGDGLLDIYFANGAEGQPDRVFLNTGAGFVDSGQSLGVETTHGVALGDVDGDGDLDALASNRGANRLWLNDGLGTFRAGRQDVGYLDTSAMALGDLDGDGDLDVFMANNLHYPSPANKKVAHAVWMNRLGGNEQLQITLQRPGTGGIADFYHTPAFLDAPVIPVSYTISGPAVQTVRQLALYYAPIGGAQWRLATTATVTATTPAISGTLAWDLAATGYFGASDDVRLRLVAAAPGTVGLTAQPAAIAGTYRYTATVSQPAQRPAVATTTFPFRTRGMLVRVVDEHGPVANAFVLRLPADGEIALPLADAGGVPYITDANGYLRGSDAPMLGDRLVALAPTMTATHAYVLYHTSLADPAAGTRAMSEVTTSGVQTLTVSAGNPLVLFDIKMSLEWDARNDDSFLADLEAAIWNASAVLYDLADGQAALGSVTVHQAKQNWLQSDVIVYAASGLRPRASMGGVVMSPVDESVTRIDGDVVVTHVIPNAYVPGQVRMGPFWDPFGQSDAELRQDWWLAFAHELAHYLLFLPDNYLGVADGYMRQIDCQGSFMTNTYEDSYRELLSPAAWAEQPACAEQSVAAYTTGRSDWETLTHFYPWLKAPEAGAKADPGPTSLPLGVTRISFPPVYLAPELSSVIPARNLDLRSAVGGELARLRQARAYLFKTQGTPALEDDRIIALGATALGSDRVKVRGAEPGDRLCVIDSGRTPMRIGCTDITPRTTSIRLLTTPDWKPDVVVTPVTSRTLAITVTQPISAGKQFSVQVFPAYGDPDWTKPLTAPVAALIPLDAAALLTFTQVITLEHPAFDGYVRVWSPGVPYRETITQYFLAGDWLAAQQQPQDASAEGAALSPATADPGTDATERVPGSSMGAAGPGWGPNDAVGRGANLRGLLAPGFGFGPNDAVGRGANQRGLTASASGFGPNDAVGRGAFERGLLAPGSGFGPNDAVGRGANLRGLMASASGFGPNDAVGRGAFVRGLQAPVTGYGPNDAVGRGAPVAGSSERGLQASGIGFGPNDAVGRGANLRGYGANRRAFDAPVASGDGRVTIFNTKDLFADPGAASLQAIDVPPGLPSWLTPVGSSYRFAATTPVTRTILFQYVEREVPRGYEHTLSIYHLPADGSGWQKLPTLIDGVQNLAVTRMPDNQLLGQGIYALIAAVEMPPLRPGWNLFAYTVPQTRTVDVALRSIEGAYDMVYRYRPDDRRWQFYDVNVDPEMAAAVNTLSSMEFGQIYLIHATATVTPYLAIAAGDPAPDGLADLASVPQLPPATLFGEVRGGGSYQPPPGSTIAAYVGDTLCGESEVVAQGEKLLYQLQVMAAAEMVQCGVPGVPVRLTVDGRPAEAEVLWDNLRSTRQDLEVP